MKTWFKTFLFSKDYYKVSRLSLIYSFHSIFKIFKKMTLGFWITKKMSMIDDCQLYTWIIYNYGMHCVIHCSKCFISIQTPENCWSLFAKHTRVSSMNWFLMYSLNSSNDGKQISLLSKRQWIVQEAALETSNKLLSSQWVACCHKHLY